MNKTYGAIRDAFITNRGVPRKSSGRLGWRITDEARLLQFLLECGTFHASKIGPSGWQCKLQVYSEFEFFPDHVWATIASAHTPETYWTTIHGPRLKSTSPDAADQFLRGVRIATKGSAQGFAAFLRRVEPPWRKDVWGRWCEATDLYGRGPSPQQRHEAQLRLKLAVKQSPATQVVTWLEQNRIIPEWRIT